MVMTAVKNIWRNVKALATRSGPWPVSSSAGAFHANGGRGSLAGVTVTEEGALSLSAVFAACSLLSRIYGSLPRCVYRKDAARRVPAYTHPAYRVLAIQPNPEMTGSMFWRTLEFHRLLWSSSYAEIQWAGSGTVKYLWPVEPWRVRPIREDGQLLYRIDNCRNVHPHDMLVQHLVSFDGVSGRRWIDYAVQSLGLGMATQDFAATYFGNGASPGTVLTLPGNYSPEQLQAEKRSWDALHAGPHNSHKTTVMWGGRSVGPAPGFNPEQSQLLEQRKFTSEEVARWLNVPPHIIRDLARSTNNNIEQQGIDFVTYSIGPTLSESEAEVNVKLLDPPKLYYKHNLDGLMRGDSVARGAFYREQWNLGAISQNEIRELEDRDPIDGGDEYFVPLNMVPLSRALAPPEPPPPPPIVGPQPPDVPPDAPTKSPPDPAPNPPDAVPSLSCQLSVASCQQSIPAMRRLLASTLTRLARVEGNALRRVGPGKLFAWMDEYYPAHLDRLREAISPLIEAASLLGLPVGGLETLPATWCQASREQLLDLSGKCKLAEFGAATLLLASGWEAGRPGTVAASLYSEDQPRGPDGRFGEGEGGDSKGENDKKEGEKPNKEEKDMSDVAKNRPSKPDERPKNEDGTPKDISPEVKPWQAPPPPQGVKGAGKSPRPSGMEAQTFIGDLAEMKAKELDFRDVLPEGQRAFTPTEKAEKGSSIDLEYDHSGKLYELKTSNTTATEYKAKPHGNEVAEKERYAKSVEATLYTMLGVRDKETMTIHFYGSKTPGMNSALLSGKGGDKAWDYLGSVKYTQEEHQAVFDRKNKEKGK